MAYVVEFPRWNFNFNTAYQSIQHHFVSLENKKKHSQMESKGYIGAEILPKRYTTSYV